MLMRPNHVVARELVLGALQLAVARRLGLGAVELGDQGRGDRLRRPPRLHQGHRVEQVRILDDDALAEGRDRHLLLVDQAAVNPGALSVRQDLRQDVERVGVRMPVVGDGVRDDHRRQRPVVGLHRHPAAPGHRRLARQVARHRLLRLRHAAEVVLDHLQRVVGLEVADEGQGGVLRHVVGVEELLHVLDRRRLDVFHRADRLVLVGMGGERLVVDDLGQQAERLVLVPPAALLLDHLALRIERPLADAERGHPIRLEPEHQRQVLRRHRLEEDRDVLGRVGVAGPADARDHRQMLVGAHVVRPLEHQVLEQVRENRCGLPARSSTRRGTHIWRFTIGVEWSSDRITVRPLSSVVM